MVADDQVVFFNTL